MRSRTGASALALLIMTIASSAGAAEPGYYKATADLEVFAHPGSREMPRIIESGEIVVSDGKTRLFGDQTWQSVSIGETSGWTRIDNLAAAEPKLLDGSLLPVAGSCGGFEPGWNVSWANGEARFTTMNGQDAALPITSAGSIEGYRYGVLQAQGPASRATLTVAEEACPFLPLDSFVWGIAHLVWHEEGQPDKVYLGCCRPIAEGYQ